jgi:hypothetical protein
MMVRHGPGFSTASGRSKDRTEREPVDDRQRGAKATKIRKKSFKPWDERVYGDEESTER